MAGHPSVAAGLPEGVLTHFAEGLRTESEGSLHEKFAEIGNASVDWIDSLANMMARDEPAAVVDEVLYAAQVVRDVRPSVVVCNVPHNAGNFLHAVCRDVGCALVCVNSTARPEPLGDEATLGLLRSRYPDVMRRTEDGGRELSRLLSERLGAALPGDQRPVTLLPGSPLLVGSAPQPHELFTGPLIRLPYEPGGGGLGGDWLEWVEASPDPVVYIAFGSLVRPTEELLGRLVEALDGGPWRVIWSLPKDQQRAVPALSERWRVTSWAPQADLLQHERVRCFLSHCGGNSSQEAMAYGVPMVCMPYYGDQYEWSRAMCEDRRGLNGYLLLTTHKLFTIC